jgi:hypothetical protein
MGTHDLHLPTGGKFLTADEVQRLSEAAKAHYLIQKRAIEAAHPNGTLILIDAEDGTFTAGTDMLEIEQRHYRTYKKPLHTACYFIVGKD